MTRMKHSPVAISTQPAVRSFALSWTAVASADDVRVNRHESLTGATAELSLHMHVYVHVDDVRRLRVQAHVRQGTSHKQLFGPVQADCTVEHDGLLHHIAITDADGHELLIVTLRGARNDERHCDVLYARTPLLDSAGFTGGRCDPPTASMLD